MSSKGKLMFVVVVNCIAYLVQAIQWRLQGGGGGPLSSVRGHSMKGSFEGTPRRSASDFSKVYKQAAGTVTTQSSWLQQPNKRQATTHWGSNHRLVWFCQMLYLISWHWHSPSPSCQMIKGQIKLGGWMLFPVPTRSGAWWSFSNHTVQTVAKDLSPKNEL